MNETWNDVTILNAEIIGWTINVGGDNRGKVAPILFGIGTIHGINEAFGVGITLVGGVGWTIVQHGFVDWVGGLVGKDASGEHRHEFFDFVNATTLHDIVVDENVFTKEFDLWLKEVSKGCVRGGELKFALAHRRLHCLPSTGTAMLLLCYYIPSDSYSQTIHPLWLPNE